jgi:mono/diheme cytochrome c family protein
MVLIMCRAMAKLSGAVLVAAMVVGVGVGCDHKLPRTVYMPDMAYSPALKAQEEGVRLPVKGTIPRGYEPFAYAKDGAAAGRELRNPLRPTMAVLKRGQHIFTTYCMTCHGPAGEGDGSVVPRFPRPPTLQSDKIRQWKDGEVYHLITVGRNLMPSYASQISAADRWAAIHYLRALQRSKHPTPDDLKIAEKESR